MTIHDCKLQTLNRQRHKQTAELICPHCFQENEDHDLVLSSDGDRENGIVCEHCSEKMDIKVEVTKCYTTRKFKGYLSW